MQILEEQTKSIMVFLKFADFFLSIVQLKVNKFVFGIECKTDENQNMLRMINK